MKFVKSFFQSFFRIARSIFLTVALICVVIFMVYNRDLVTISLRPLPIEIETRIFVVMIFSFILGALFALLLCSKNFISSAFKHFSDQRKIKKLQKLNIK